MGKEEEYLLPRSEYYTRFDGTTALSMGEPDYYGTYHRSEASRFFSRVGGRNVAQFQSPFLQRPAQADSFYAHTGGFHSPFSFENYAQAISLDEQVEASDVNVRDELLAYKNRMAQKVVDAFRAMTKNEQLTSVGSVRPIVYTENLYPCVLVQLPVLNPAQINTDATRYWSKHPKIFQRFLFGCFVGILNVEAMRENIPIEMVLRASFGHNQPSVCETNNTFRINVGLVPEKYATLIGKVLALLIRMIADISDREASAMPFDAMFLAHIRQYNAAKLKHGISSKPIYKALVNSRDFQKASESDEALDRLYQAFCDINRQTKPKGQARVLLVSLANKTVWEAMRCVGDSMGKSVLSECFRKESTVDWFVDQVMESLLAKKDRPIEVALIKLLGQLCYGETASMNYAKINEALKRAKRKFIKPSFEPFYAEDKAFARAVDMLCHAFMMNRPAQGLYAAIEEKGIKFLAKHRVSKVLETEPDLGSDSAFSDDLKAPTSQRKNHFAHKKIRVCSGMKAILIAHRAALGHLHAKGETQYRQSIGQMYYEVEEATSMVAHPEQLKLNNVRASTVAGILHYDLNHCNAKNSSAHTTLEKSCDDFKPSVVILDCVSSSLCQVKRAMQVCLDKAHIELVMFVSSGLKNDQGGLDFNPYGEVRVCARSKVVVDAAMTIMKQNLSVKDRLSAKTHEMVRVCKARGLAMSLLGFFKGEAAEQARIFYEKRAGLGSSS